MAEGLAGKVTLITGGASGIGRATAVAFAQAGAPLVIADVDVAGGEEIAHLITRQGGEALFVQADVSRAADVKALIGKAIQMYGRLDCAFNNAGIYSTSPVADAPEEEWERIIRTNLTGVRNGSGSSAPISQECGYA